MKLMSSVVRFCGSLLCFSTLAASLELCASPRLFFWADFEAVLSLAG